MAIVNPPIPRTPDSNFLNYSNAINVPDNLKPRGQEPTSIKPTGVAHVDQSKEIAMTGMGNLFASGAKAVANQGEQADYIIKKDLQDEVYTGVDRIRDEETYARETIRNNPSLLKAQAQALPQDLEDLGETVSGLHNAAKGGHASPTLYYSRLKSLAKSLRGIYPGYRDYIDSEIHKVTGVDPANAHLNSLLADINYMSRANAGQNTEAKQAYQLAKENLDIPEVTSMYAGYVSGKSSFLTFMNTVGKYKSGRADIEREKAEIALSGARREVKEDEARVLLGRRAFMDADLSFTSLNLGQGLETPQKMAEEVSRLHREGVDFSPEQIEQMHRNVMEQKSSVVQRIFNEESKKGGLVERFKNPDDAKKIIESRLFMFNEVADSLKNKDWGLAFVKTNIVKAMKEAGQHDLMTHEKLGGLFRTLNAIKEVGSPEVVQELWINTLKSNYANMGAMLGSYVTNEQMKLLAQPNLTTTGGVSTLKAGIAAVKDLNTSKELRAKSVDDFITQAQKIGDPNFKDDTFKKNLIIATFHPNNRGLIGDFEREYWNNEQNREVPGKFGIYQRLTSDAVAKEVYRLGQNNPKLIQYYNNWVKETFADELFSTEVLDLRQVADSKNIQLKWDDKKHEWEVLRVGRQPSPLEIGGTDIPRFEEVKERVDKINQAFKPFVFIGKNTSQDPNDIIFNLLKTMRFDTENVNPSTIPEKMARSVGKSREKPDSRSHGDRN